MIQIRDFLPRIVQIVAHTKGGAVLWTLLVVLSRLPLVGGIFPDNIGLSSDVDASGIATSVMILWHEGRYIPSRAPGYFLNEAANALFYPLGWWSANLFWSFIYGLSCCVYARLLLILGIPHAFWVLVAYSFFPLIVVENASVTEYTLSNVFLVLSWYSLIRSQPVASGVWMGCALASRISQTPVALLIFAVALWARDRHWKSVVLFILAATVLTIALWLIPMRLLTSNWEFLAGAVWEGSLLQRVLAAGYDIYRAFGLLGMIVSVAYVFFGLSNLFRQVKTDLFSIPFWITITSLIIIFLQPHKPGYALIMVPFLYPFLASFKSRLCFPSVVIATLSFLIVSVPYINFRDNKVIFYWIGSGKVVQELKYRQQEWRLVNILMSQPPTKSIVILGYRPYFRYLFRQLQYKGRLKNVQSRNGLIYLTSTDTYIVTPPSARWVGVKSIEPASPEKTLKELLRRNYKAYYLPDAQYRSGYIADVLKHAKPLDFNLTNF